jgi:hypothetical protein
VIRTMSAMIPGPTIIVTARGRMARFTSEPFACQT